MKEIRSWKLGILILDPKDGIGIDCKFQNDSIVMITNQLMSEVEYL